MTLFPYLYRTAVAALTTDANSLRVVTAITKWRGTPGTDPLTASGMAFFLLLETFAKFFEQFLQTAQRLDLSFCWHFLATS